MKIVSALFLVIIACIMAGCDENIYISPETTIQSIQESTTSILYENDIGVPPLNFAPFIYTEDSTFDFFRELYDTDGCIPGYLYVYDERTKESVQVTNFPVLDLTETQECIFYVTEDYKIVRTNYTGDYHKVIYTAAHGAISKIEYGYGKLTFPDGDHVMVMDLNAGTCQDVFQMEKVESVSHCAVGTNLFICGGGDYFGLDYSTGKTCRFSSYQAGFDFISRGVWPEMKE